jgi:hypothetical protein
MKKYILIASLLFLTIACNKNQKAVKLLAGDWEATKLVTTGSDGTAIDLLTGGFVSVDYNFDNCKLKDDNYCNMTTTTSISVFGFINESTVTNDLFTIKGDGKIMEVKTDSTANTINITELSKTTLKASQTNSNNETIDIELKKK